MNIEEILTPDKNSLDKEWIRQPEYMLHYLDEMAASRIKMDAAKENIDEIKASVDSDIRKNPRDYGLEKLTETVIANTLLLQDTVKKAQKQYLEAKEEYYKYSNIVQALEHRKAALENLVKLFGLGYYAQPSDVAMNDEVTKQKAKENVTKKRGRPRKED